ncbi:MAG: MotA/TolQ/ExbB proton channel family protein [Candidatus Glassbacteria bacterium]
MELSVNPGNGLFLYLIIICAILILSLILHKFYSLLIKRRVNTEELLKEVLICIDAREFEGAIELCERSEAPINRILIAGLKEFDTNFNHNEELARHNTLTEITFSVSPDITKKEEAIKREMDEVALGAFRALRWGIGYLPALAKIVLLLGVTGTVFGIMNILSPEAASIEYGFRSLLTGISQSLFTTLLGLIIAIPTVLAHSFVSNRVQFMIDEAEEASRVVLNAMLKK